MADEGRTRFDLEKAIATWRHVHEQRHTFLREDLDELERHLRDHAANLIAKGAEPEAAFGKALQALGDLDGGETEYRKVRWRKLRRRRQIGAEIGYRFAMLRSHVRIALRNVRKHKLYASINVLGLSVGIACCLLIALYVMHELSYDRFHPKGERIYRLLYDDRLGADLPPAARHEYLA